MSGQYLQPRSISFHNAETNTKKYVENVHAIWFAASYDYDYLKPYNIKLNLVATNNICPAYVFISI